MSLAAPRTNQIIKAANKELSLLCVLLKHSFVIHLCCLHTAIKPYETIEVEVSHEGKRNRLPLLVVKGSLPTLLGRNWLKKVRLDVSFI